MWKINPMVMRKIVNPKRFGYGEKSNKFFSFFSLQNQTAHITFMTNIRKNSTEPQHHYWRNLRVLSHGFKRNKCIFSTLFLFLGRSSFVCVCRNKIDRTFAGLFAKYVASFINVALTRACQQHTNAYTHTHKGPATTNPFNCIKTSWLSRWFIIIFIRKVCAHVCIWC